MFNICFFFDKIFSMRNSKKILFLFLILLVFIAIDIIGYILIEEVKFIDALYMTVISITTVGYSEVFPLSSGGRLFTVWVIVSGLGTFFYIAGKIAENTFEGNIRRILGRRKMKMLLKMKEHVIVAGFGVMGEQVCRELCQKKIKFVVIEHNSERFAIAEEQEFNVIMGDATNEEDLLKAGAQKAATFISLLATDADNIFTVMAVHELNPKVMIISRALDIANEKRLYKVGANRVVTPYELGSRRIVNTVVRPNVVDFIDLMAFSPRMALSIEELTVSEESPFARKQIKNSGLRENYNIIVIAIKRGDDMFFNPSPLQEILPNDILILVGEKEKMLELH
jgi:voltage-gated potassium channel